MARRRRNHPFGLAIEAPVARDAVAETDRFDWEIGT